MDQSGLYAYEQVVKEMDKADYSSGSEMLKVVPLPSSDTTGNSAAMIPDDLP